MAVWERFTASLEICSVRVRAAYRTRCPIGQCIVLIDVNKDSAEWNDLSRLVVDGASAEK